MWLLMMVAMMLPSLVPMLHRYRLSVGAASAARLGRLTAVAAAGYFMVWTALGIIAFAAGVGLASLTMQHLALARAVPTATGAVVLLAGAFQFTRWKARSLECCRVTPACRCAPATADEQPLSTYEVPPFIGHRLSREFANDSGSAFRHGLQLGLQCCLCCAGFTAILLVLGAMSLRVMAAVTVAITIERLAPAGEGVARVIGAILIVAGATLLARSAGFG
jgi:predicted metal-binding membrane protein